MIGRHSTDHVTTDSHMATLDMGAARILKVKLRVLLVVLMIKVNHARLPLHVV